MIDERSKNIEFDRAVDKLTVPNFINLVHVRLMQLSSRTLAPIGYLGISRLQSFLGKITNLKNDTRISENGFHFAYPSNDYYWNRMLDLRWNYEPEIDIFLTIISKIPFVFIDLGANFGYWTAKVGSGIYGPHMTVAVEPSAFAFQYLETNSAALKNEVRCKCLAISNVSGEKIDLYGSRHAGLSTSNQWPGAYKINSTEVETISIDDLVAREKIDLETTLLVIKLDVEGAELQAIQGAANVLNANSILIVEDAERNGVSDALAALFNETGFGIYMITHGRPQKIHAVDDFVAHKRATKSMQMVGLNVIATKSPKWTKIIDELQSN